jgi:hypothetical protein
VGGVGDEVPLRSECGLESPEQPVDRVGQVAQLIARPVEGEAMMEVVL